MASQSSSAYQLPDWLSTKCLPSRRYRLAGTGNVHGLQAGEYLTNIYPLPSMFGDEHYAYSLVDIEDPRYLEEAGRMSRGLIRFFNEHQIIDIEWKKVYAELREQESRLAALPGSASQKARDELKTLVADAKQKLLDLQVQKDLYAAEIQKIFDRCAAIKDSIKKENDLQQLADELTALTREKFAATDPFWSTTFKVDREETTESSNKVNLDDLSDLELMHNSK